MKKYLLLSVFGLCIVLFIATKIDNSIKGKKILVTAPINYNKRLSTLINKSGAEAIEMPTIKITLNTNAPQLDTLFHKLTQYICLPSKNAIKVYFKKAKSLGIDYKTLSTPTYSAIGKDIEYLKTFNIKYILKCKRASPLGIINALKEEKEGIRNKHIAVLCPEVIGLSEPNVIPDFLNDLKKIGLKVKRINAYTTEINDGKDFTTEISAIKTGYIDLIAFTSSAEIEALIKMVGGKDNLTNTKIACFGPYTGFNAERLGLKVSFISEDYSSFDGYISSIKTYFSEEHK